MAPKLTVKRARSFLVDKYGEELVFEYFERIVDFHLGRMIQDAERVAGMRMWNLNNPDLPISEQLIDAPSAWLYDQYQRLLEEAENDVDRTSIRTGIKNKFDGNGKIKVETSQLYLIEMKLPGNRRARPVKIGISDDPRSRINSLQTASPFVLRLIAEFSIPDVQKVEGELHKKLANRKMRGEWFILSPDDVDDIKDILGELSVA